MEVGGGTKHERLLQDKPNSIVLVALYDDGYGSSNSSPHSTVFHIQNSSPNQGKGCKGVKQESTSNQEVTQPTNTPPMEKKELEAGLVGETVVCRTLSVTTVTKETEGKFIGDDGRETWRSNADFLLSIIGFAVDLANVWRFPYLCYRNGGGAFLIPYTLMLVFGAMPLFYMELALGQYNRQGPVSVWKICPIFKGVGMCAVVVAFIVSFYYNVIIAWALYYLVDSFSYTLPWVNCNNTWNSKSCQVTGIHLTSFLNGTDGNSSSIQQMLDANFSSIENSTGPLSDYSPASEYFNREVLGMQYSEGLQDFGTPKWQMVICIFIVYCMLYLSLFKGVKSSGKVVWVTAIMPYVVLAILLVRGLMLPGAVSGIKYYLKPELSKLKETRVWLDAAVQIFFSVGAGFGVHLSYASYNNFHNNCLMDCIITTAVNSFTSFFSGFVIFTYLGFMSHKAGIPISSVATEGAGLVFQVYPEAVATLPGSQFWSILFFFMLIMLGLDSGMGGLECVITGLMDEFKNIFKEKWISREKFTLIIVFTSFCVATLNAAPGGIYMFHLLDTYAAGVSLLCSAFFEAIAVSWFYGIERLCKDIEEMLGFQPGLFFRICWKFISPLFIFFVVFFGLLNHEPLKYGDYNYPVWAECIGWAVSLASILMIPGLAILQIIKTPGSFRDRIAYSITPIEEHAKMRETKEVTRFKCKHWLYI